LILLCDLDLLELPLESLKCFHNNSSICSLTRDFSLQFFATRFLQKDSGIFNLTIMFIFIKFKLKNVAETTDDKKDDKGRDKAAAGGKADKGKPLPVSSGEPLPENALVIDHTRLKYLIDVFNESSAGCI
jgi:hypothetical protein